MVYPEQNSAITRVTAKFRCNNITDTKYGTDYLQRRVNFSAVYGKEGDNKDYAQATPWGELSIQIDKSTPAFDAFIPGQDYYLTFSKTKD